MGLQIPPEELIPQSQKEEWRNTLQRGGGKLNPARATIKQGTWLTTPLWNYGWKEELKKNGISWQKFMELYRNCHHNFIGWIEGTVSWEQAIRSLIKEIENEVRRSEAVR